MNGFAVTDTAAVGTAVIAIPPITTAVPGSPGSRGSAAATTSVHSGRLR